MGSTEEACEVDVPTADLGGLSAFRLNLSLDRLFSSRFGELLLVSSAVLDRQTTSETTVFGFLATCSCSNDKRLDF